MAWFRWRKNKDDETREQVEQAPLRPEYGTPPEEPNAYAPPPVAPPVAPPPPAPVPVVPDPAAPAAPGGPVDPVAPATQAPAPSPAPGESGQADPESPAASPTSPAHPAPATDPAADPAVPVVPPVPVAPVAPVRRVDPLAIWNPGLNGVVVRITHTHAGPEGSAHDVRLLIEAALEAAVGDDSPAPADADPEHPIVVNLTIVEELVDADVTEILGGARKQLARKAPRVRLVVDQVPADDLG